MPLTATVAGQMPTPGTGTVIHAGTDEVLALFADSAFVDQWLALRAACPWATPFQRPEFVAAWYQHYGDTFTPVLATRHDSRGALVWLLALAHAHGVITGAGASQAEYQCWLASEGEASTRFLAETIGALRQRFPRSLLRLRYLSPILLAHVEPLAGMLGGVEIQRHRRPLMRLAPGDANFAKRKKRHARKYDKLRKAGQVEFLHVGCSAFPEVLDEIIPYYELRQGAANDSWPFTADIRKRAFHLALMEAMPDRMHVTVLRAGGQLVSAQVNLADRGALHLGISAHSPFFAAVSPGRLHMILLAEDLAAQGYGILDLTPGGDPWKETFANDHDDVLELRAYPSRFGPGIRKVRDWSVQRGKLLVRQLGLDVPRLRAAVRGLGSARKHVQTLVVYSGSAGEAREAAAGEGEREGVECARDRVRDLLLPCHAGRREFVADALARIERGEQLFTCRRGDALLCCLFAGEQESAGGTGAEPPAVDCRTRVLHLRILDAKACTPDTLRPFLGWVLREVLADTSDDAAIELSAAANPPFPGAVPRTFGLMRPLPP